jgi:tetratricopeptide (TPR) repeat protein
MERLGDEYYAIDNYKQAIQCYEKVLPLLSSGSYGYWRSDFGKSRIYNRLARSYFETDEYPKAINAYKKTIELDPENTAASYMLGLAYFQLSQYPEAISVFSLYSKAKPDDPRSYCYAHYFLGRAYYENKQDDSALSAYLKAVQLKSDLPSDDLSDLYFSLGLVYLKLERLEDAENAYKKALELDKDNAKTLLNLGVCHGRRGQKVLAADYYYRAGIIFLQRNDREGAVGALNNLSTTESPLYEKLYSKIYPDVPLKKEKEKK